VNSPISRTVATALIPALTLALFGTASVAHAGAGREAEACQLMDDLNASDSGHSPEGETGSERKTAALLVDSITKGIVAAPPQVQIANGLSDAAFPLTA
jgi:hypothetical protein